MEKLLSIIIPVYNGENYIVNLVDSIEINNKDIVDQLELLLINDGSMDNSLDACQGLAKQYSNIIVFTKENEGIASTREYGVCHSTGKYITFCDQDDKVVKGYQTFIDKLENNRCDMLMSNYICSGFKDEMVRFIFADAVYYTHDIHLILANFMWNGFVDKEVFSEKQLPNIATSVWNCIFNRQFIINKQIYCLRFVDFEDDWIYIISTLSNAKKLYVSKDYYYCWNKNPTSESNTYKFVSEYFKKRHLLLQWTLTKLSKLGVCDEKENEFVLTFDSQTILLGFRMFCGLKYPLYKCEIKSITEFGDLRKYRYTNFLGGNKRYLRWLLHHRLYIMAYYLYRYFPR